MHTIAGKKNRNMSTLSKTLTLRIPSNII